MTGRDLFGAMARAPGLTRGGARKRATAPGDSGYARIAKDAYNTPPWCVDVLVAALARHWGDLGALQEPILEPCCGLGLIVTALRAAHGAQCGRAVIAADIDDYGFEGWIKRNYLTTPLLTLPDGTAPRAIVTNPPFNLSEAFAELALKQMITARPAADSGQVILLLPLEWDCAGGRRDLIDDPAFGFAAKITLRQRIVWIGPDGRPLGQGRTKKTTPTKHHAWFVWDRRLRQAPAPVGGAARLIHA
jgi:hypothetical protein